MNEEISTGKEPTSRALVFTRHLVAVAIVAYLNPYWVVSLNDGATKALEVFLGAFVFSSVLAELALLFFKRGTGKDWRGNFVRLLCVFYSLNLDRFMELKKNAPEGGA